MYLLGVALRLMCALLIVTIPVEAAERLPRSISLAQALQRALAANPRLTAAERDIGIAGGLKIASGQILCWGASHAHSRGI
jgi:outer membrane protein, heavy metal efflux system